MGGAKETGSILVLSLWSASIFSILLLSLAFQTSIQLELTKAEWNEFEGRWELISGLNTASLVIASDEDPYNDSPQDGWSGELKVSTPWNDRFSIYVEDEESKLNLNLAGEKLLTALFEKLGAQRGIFFKEDVKDIVKNLLKWRGDKKNQRFDFLDEVLLIEGVEKDDFEAFKPYVTVVGDATAFPAVNVNTVLPPVLEAIIQSLPGDSLRKKELLERILSMRTAIGNEPSPLQKEELVPNLFLAKLKITPTIEMVSLANQLVPYLATDSSYFHLRIQLKGKPKKSEAIIRQSGDSLYPSILYWNEE